MEYGVKTEEQPHILTISEFMGQLARLSEASKTEQLFLLYNCYKSITGVKNNEDNFVDFGSFRNWGETVISDFNTVDINLVEPTEIFKNIKDYREISSNFLTDEQKEVMKEYFGFDDWEDGEAFWRTFKTESKLKNEFLNLWQILAPLHKMFIQLLTNKGLGTAGSIYKKAVERLKEKGKDILPYNKIVLIGFNALSESERTLFCYLRDLERGSAEPFTDFIWDIEGPVLNDEAFSASRFVRYNIKHFPEPEWYKEASKVSLRTDYPEIRIISAPSLTSQAKVAGEILKNYQSTIGKKEIAEADVALILPDENLLPNIIYSLPEDIGDINLTMGYSLKETSVASYIGLVRRVFSGMKENKSGEKFFFVKFIRHLFSHPYSFILFNTTEIESLINYLNDFHIVRIKESEIKEYIPSFSDVFKFKDEENPENSVFILLETLLDKLTIAIQGNKELSEENNELEQLGIISKFISRIKSQVKYYKMSLASSDLFQLLDKMISLEKIGFEGEKLSGLQVMGTLETRGLDFKHVIILSMNEGVMPRKSGNPTFIPEALRKAYGLPPARYAEEIFGYYFYRLLSRADKVTLIYDGRTVSGLRGGESRYLLQLREYAPKNKLTEESWLYHLQGRENTDSSIIKTETIKKRLQNFLIEGEERKNFSASSLNTYRECQVKFFLQNVLNLSTDPERGDYPDAITIGNILHDAMMHLYLPTDLHHKLLRQPFVITREILDHLLENPGIISQTVLDSIRRIYYKSDEKENKQSSGIIDILAEQINRLIEEIVRYDLKLAPFNLYGCEITKLMRVSLSSGKIVNFRFAIDRLDEISTPKGPMLRIVDYKTGSRKRSAEDLEEVFKGGYKSEQIFQLFTYAWLLSQLKITGSEEIITEIYYVPDLIAGERGLPEIKGEKVEDFSKFSEEFSRRLEEMIEELFDSEIFQETQEKGSCLYCSFKSFCGK
ncbi:MAG: PD-(D/E)XK nuclease family protein [Muribaculaceae bacterium]|nr:PD-(D/E)XK nuclease family protein [Muribaculaceae bacterium]